MTAARPDARAPGPGAALPGGRGLFWALLAASLALQLLMVRGTLPRIAAEAGGLAPLDLRPLGYGPDEARAFLSALSERGRALYLGPQHRLDWAYPALLGATFAVGFARLARGWVLGGLLLLAAAVTAFDWIENRAVAELLRADPGALDPARVAAAAGWTVAKSAATALAWTALLAGGLARWRGRRRGA